MLGNNFFRLIGIFLLNCICLFLFLSLVCYFTDIFNLVDMRYLSINTLLSFLVNPWYFLNLIFFLNVQLSSFFFSFDLFHETLQLNYLWYLYSNKYPYFLSIFYFNPLLGVSNLVYNYLDFPVFFYFGVFFFLTTILSFLFFNYLGLYGVFCLNLLSLSLFWVSLLFYFNAILLNNMTYKVFLGKWFYLNINYLVNFDFLIDKVSFSFMFLTVSIALFVYIYAFSYFRYEPLVERLLLFLCSFVLSMVFLVTSGNFIMMFLGWELIGLTSFFLINFWVTRVGTLKAAFKAFVFNKVSDLFFFFFILLVFNLFYDLDVLTFNSQLAKYSNFTIFVFNFEINFIEISSFLLMFCAFIKSAQIGAHIWLPDSMEAPVPASALIHSATLVSAGIFLILRFHPLIELSTYCLFIIPLVGSITAIYGGLVAAFQSDIKRILAYSTISHCGFLMVISMLYSTEFTIFYLYVHGFFKATVFLNVGNVIRFSKNYQDFRRMGGFYKYLPFDCFMSFLCLFNLAGLPFSLGFFMKHFFFLIFTQNFYLFLYIYLNVFFGALFGLFYSYRLFYNVFFDFKKGRKAIYLQTNNSKLNSQFFSNSSLASNCAILSLFIVAYLVIIYLYVTILDLSNNFSDYDNMLINNTFFLKNNLNLNVFYNSSFINWIVIILINIIIFSSFRARLNEETKFLSFFEFIVFIIFFYFFYIILS